MQTANEAAAKVAGTDQEASKGDPTTYHLDGRVGPFADSYKLGALAQAVRLYLIHPQPYERDLINRLSAEVVGREPIVVRS